MKKLISVLALALILTLAFVTVISAEGDAASEAAVEEGSVDTVGAVSTTIVKEDDESMIGKIINGQNLAIFGAALVAGIACMGSAKAVSIVGSANSAILSEEPSLFGKLFLLQALPMTQGVYGLVTALLILMSSGIMSGAGAELSLMDGAFYLMAALPYTFVGYFSAVQQGKAAIAGANLCAKRPDQLGKAITMTALVETYAIFGLLVSLLTILSH